MSLTGVRVYGEEAYEVGALVKLEFFTDSAGPVKYTAEVVRVDVLPPGSPAKFDIGMKFVDLTPKALQLLATLLVPGDD